MVESYRMISQPDGEPRPAGHVGARVRVQLSGFPSRRWSRVLAACLSREIVGHDAIGHLRVDAIDIVQGDQIVLEGVERRAAPGIAVALQRAVEAANAAAPTNGDEAPNMTQEEAHAVAQEVAVTDPNDNQSGQDVDAAQCPSCGQPVSRTVAGHEQGGQLAVSTIECPHCGATLARDVDGPADRGWRLTE
jgi:endogenous inhibitor of DNA gyrase (YacG/DUF329 family)